jgi:dihydropteroate synthase
MNYNLRAIFLEKPSDAAEEKEALQIPVEEWEGLTHRMSGFGLFLEQLSREEAEALREEARSQGLEVFYAVSSLAKGKILLYGSRRGFEGLAARCSTIPVLTGIAGDLQGAQENLFQESYCFRCGRYTLELGKRTHLMGVLNITPDSFSDGGRFFHPEQAIIHGQRLVEEGADILDVGGESSRPGALPLSAKEELDRILPPVRSLVKLGIPISVDTYKAEVARVVLQEGASLINDISGLRLDPSLAKVVARAGTGLVIMHMKGTPQDMQRSPHYDSLMGEITGYFREGIARAESEGVNPESILIDPGLGFGKDFVHNLTLLRRLREFKCLGKPILIGPSRKTFTGRILNLPVEERLEGTSAAVAWAVCRGAHIVRVHDVKEMKRIVAMTDALRDGGEL